MNKTKMRRGIKRGIGYQHLYNRIEAEELLDDLGIDYSFRQGTQVMCHCPDLSGRHKNGDANPSFGFKEDTLAFNCFVCGGGNVIELVQMMKPELKEEEEVVAYLEQFAGDPASPQDLLSKAQGIMTPEKASPMPDYPEDSLFKFRQIHPYLYERGLSREIIVEMQVGFTEEHCGIVIPHMFQGKLRGWQIRHLAMQGEKFICDFCEDESGKSMAKGKVSKYKNTTRFPSSNTVYGYDRFKTKFKESDGKTCIVVESPMTALKLMSMGFDNVVATFGQFNREQGMLLMAVPTVYFWPDNDKAGYENSERAISTLGRYTVVKIVPVIDKIKGDAADLDSAEQVREYLDAAYASSLFPLLAKDKLPTLEELNGT